MLLEGVFGFLGFVSNESSLSLTTSIGRLRRVFANFFTSGPLFIFEFRLFSSSFLSFDIFSLSSLESFLIII